MKKAMLLPLIAFVAIWLVGCGEDDSAHKTTSDDIQQTRQEVLLRELAARVGMPNIVNFREAFMLKQVLELRDQNGLVTYTYLENMVPTVIPGHTVLGGKLTYVGESVGYGIPAATQFTNPQKAERHSTFNNGNQWITLPHADPNGLFSPASADGTWVMMYDSKQKMAIPQFFEPRVVVLTIKFPFDTAPQKGTAEREPDKK